MLRMQNCIQHYYNIQLRMLGKIIIFLLKNRCARYGMPCAFGWQYVDDDGTSTINIGLFCRADGTFCLPLSTVLNIGGACISMLVRRQ